MPSVAPVVSNLVKLGPNHSQVHVDNTIQLAAATTKVTMSGEFFFFIWKYILNLNGICFSFFFTYP